MLWDVPLIGGPHQILGVILDLLSFVACRSFFPFTYPVAALGRLRQHIVSKLGKSSNFDEALGEYTKTVANLDWSFSQFVIMGVYAEHFEKDLVHTMSCAPATDQSASANECASWLPLGVHYGWRYCHVSR